MKKRLLAILMLFTVILTACGGGNTNNSTEEAVTELEDRTYILGLDDTFFPMGFRDEKGEIVGFDIDLAQESAKRMGIIIELQPVDWTTKEAELDSGNIDFIWNGFSITPEREEKVAFSKPYMDNRQLIITLADSSVNSKEDLAGKTVTVQAESSALEAVQKEPEFIATLKDETIIEYPTNVECFKDVEAGRSDAIVVDEVLARYYMKNNGEENYKILEEDFGIEEYAVGMRKNDTALIEALNTALDEMKSDGSFDEIYKKWFSDN